MLFDIESMREKQEAHQDVEFISTGNANENAPMLSINKRMGFKNTKEVLVLR